MRHCRPRLAGPFGGFDYRQGGDEQIWIAGGIGITPFLELDPFARRRRSTRSVDFYYAVRHEGDALYADEIAAASARHPSLRTHIVSSERDGLLTADAILSGRGAGTPPWIYMCGPPPMMRTLDKGFRRLGVPGGRIRWEQFEAR